MTENKQPDIFGIYPPLSFEGDIVNKLAEANKGLARIDRSLQRMEDHSPPPDVDPWGQPHWEGLSEDIDTLIDEIDEVGFQITQEISGSADRVIDAVRHSGYGIAATVNQSGNQVTGAIEQIGHQLENLEQISRSNNQLLRESLANTARQWLEQGLYWFDRQEWGKAETLFQRSLECNTRNFLAYYYLARMRHGVRNWTKAIYYLTLASKCATDKEQLLQALLLWADSCYCAGDVPNGIKVAQEALRIEPNSVAASFAVAFYFASGDVLINVWWSYLWRAMLGDERILQSASSIPPFSAYKGEIDRILAEHYAVQEKNRIAQQEADEAQKTLRAAQLRQEAEEKLKIQKKEEEELQFLKTWYENIARRRKSLRNRRPSAHELSVPTCGTFKDATRASLAKLDEETRELEAELEKILERRVQDETARQRMKERQLEEDRRLAKLHSTFGYKLKAFLEELFSAGAS